MTIALIAALSTFDLGAVAVVAAFGFLTTSLRLLWRVRRVKLLALPPERSPRVFALVKRCRERLEMRVRAPMT
ncbi:MAG: hypothetical protein MUF54_23620 [Polyangiaceae bacterium]|nr:hypothetical protein [Polyangiaceae bacterium]